MISLSSSWFNIMKRGVWLAGWLLLAACVEAAPAGGLGETAALAAAPEFAAFYDAHGQLRTFGYPLTGSFVVPDSGRTVQYFQNLRLELNPTNGQVEVSPLGTWTLEDAGRIHDAAAGADLAAALPFRDFYQQYGGEALFGPAVSAQVEEGGRWVQYFHNARLEWHAEAIPELRVQVAQLGYVHYWGSGAIYMHHDQLRDQDKIPTELAGLRQVNITAAAAYPILFAGDQQRLSVVVLTPDGYPVINAPVLVTLTFQDGQTQSVSLPLTDNAGKTIAPITLNKFTPGEIVQMQIIVQSAAGSPLGTYELLFKMWW